MRALGVVLGVSMAVACSSSSTNTGSSSIVGEWQIGGDEIWFNADGTCGEQVTAGGQNQCATNCTYSLSGSALTISFSNPGGSTTSSTSTISISGGTLTIGQPSSSGATINEMLTRVNSSGSNGCADGGNLPPPPPDAFVQATVGPGTQNPAACPLSGSPTAFVTLGMPSGGKPTTVTNGGSTPSGSATVTCTVHASGSGFDVSLEASVPGPSGGFISISSPAGQGAVTMGGGTGLTASFTSTQHGAYSANGCTLSFMYQGAQVPVSPPVAAGRIWGHVSCPHAQLGTNSCDAEADFLFEQCTE